MNINHDHIHIFKTNIKTSADEELIANIFKTKKSIEGWSIDREDSDCVLRVISSTLNQSSIIELVTIEGFQCTQL